MTAQAPQTINIRVRYAETDKMGVVYHANYFTWFEIGPMRGCFARLAAPLIERWKRRVSPPAASHRGALRIQNAGAI
jgi:hypothetical protein